MGRQYFAPGETVYLRFNTHEADGTPITLAGTPAISVYKDGSTTESTAGVSLTVDVDSRTGLHLVTIDTSADGAFYAAGSDFDVVITTGTVDSISVVGTKVGGFTTKTTPAPTSAEIADKLLGRSLAGGADGGRTVRDALRPMRNKVAFDVPSAGQFTVFAEDDVTPAWTGTYTVSVGASPVTVLDPT